MEHSNYAAVRKGDWKAIKHLKEEEWELFNLKKDRTESRDVSSDFPEIVQDLDKAWHRWAYSHDVLPKKIQR